MAIMANLVYDVPANLCGQLVSVYLGTSGAATDEGARRQESGGNCGRGSELTRDFFTIVVSGILIFPMTNFRLPDTELPTGYRRSRRCRVIFNGDAGVCLTPEFRTGRPGAPVLQLT